MTGSLRTCFRVLAGLTLPPWTDHPVQVAHLLVDGQRVAVWADRPARGLTKIMLVDASSAACGDATLQGGTLTVTLPDTWCAAAACLISRIVHQDEVSERAAK